MRIWLRHVPGTIPHCCENTQGIVRIVNLQLVVLRKCWPSLVLTFLEWEKEWIIIGEFLLCIDMCDMCRL